MIPVSHYIMNIKDLYKIAKSVVVKPDLSELEVRFNVQGCRTGRTKCGARSLGLRSGGLPLKQVLLIVACFPLLIISRHLSIELEGTSAWFLGAVTLGALMTILDKVKP